MNTTELRDADRPGRAHIAVMAARTLGWVLVILALAAFAYELHASIQAGGYRMIEAERSMRETLAGVSLNDLAERSSAKMPNTFLADAENWFEARQVERGAAPRKQK